MKSKMGFISDLFGGLVSLLAVAKSGASSTQTAQASIAQSYSGTCNFSCNNSISEFTQVLEHVNLQGSDNMENICFMDPVCVMNNSMSAIADVVFAAKNSAQSNAGSNSVFNVFSYDSTYAKSYQNIVSDIQQQATQTCGQTTYNDMDNVLMFISDSNIEGDINIVQIGSVNGSCTLNDSMSAQIYASGTSNNSALAGPQKKSKGTIPSILEYVVVPIVLLAAIYIVMKIIQSTGSSSSQAKGQAQPVINPALLEYALA